MLDFFRIQLRESKILFPTTFFFLKICQLLWETFTSTTYLHQGDVRREPGVARKAGFFESVDKLFVDQPQVAVSLLNLGVYDLVAKGIDSLEFDVELIWHRLDNMVPQSPLDHLFGLFKLVLLNIGSQESDVGFFHWNIVTMRF